MKYTIIQDTEPESPRNWDNLGTMVCWHRRYNLGDEHDYPSPDSFNEEIKEDKNIILPLFLYDHGGITISTSSFSCRWDSGQIGFIYISFEKIKKEFSWVKLSKKRINQIRSYLIAEVSTYDQYLTGDVYGYNIESDAGDHLDSCWELYGYDYCEQEAIKAMGHCQEEMNASNIWV